MFNLKNKVITIDNINSYLVVEVVCFKGRTFVFLVNEVNPLDVMYKEVIKKDDCRIVQIESGLFKEKILPLFIEKFNSYKKDIWIF